MPPVAPDTRRRRPGSAADEALLAQASGCWWRDWETKRAGRTLTSLAQTPAVFLTGQPARDHPCSAPHETLVHAHGSGATWPGPAVPSRALPPEAPQAPAVDPLVELTRGLGAVPLARGDNLHLEARVSPGATGNPREPTRAAANFETDFGGGSFPAGPASQLPYLFDNQSPASSIRTRLES